MKKCKLCGKKLKERNKVFCSFECSKMFNILKHKSNKLIGLIGKDFQIIIKTKKKTYHYDD